MTEQTNKPPFPTPLASVDANLFGAILEFHKKTMTLLRQAKLADDKLKVVADRINILLDSATEEVKQTPQLNVKERLDVAYEEIKRLVEQNSWPSDRRKD